MAFSPKLLQMGASGAGPANYIEDVFSTYLYTGNGSTQTITNGIDLSTKGGLVWGKSRADATAHNLYDTVRGASNRLASSLTNAQANTSPAFSSFNTNGFSLNGASDINNSSDSIVSWTFREQPKFFDVVTYTGDGTVSKVVSHSLNSTPGAIIIKRTDASTNWTFTHRSFTNGLESALNLNSTSSDQASSGVYGVTSTSFTVSDGTSTAGSTTINSNNVNGATYVAYLFAHNAGGFGLTGSDNVISCGSTLGSGTVNLGYEPQWILVKSSTRSDDWTLVDNMRGAPTPILSVATTPYPQELRPNTSGAETTNGLASADAIFNSTGFRFNPDTYVGSATYIYIAIRRGPMKVPTLGTSVYESASRTGTASVIPRWVAGFPVDMGLRQSNVTAGGSDWQLGDRLRGPRQIKPNLTEAEEAQSVFTFDSMTGWSNLGAAGSNTSDRTWMFRRAPGFFDEVCYTGTASNPGVLTHNLGVVPELMIVKQRGPDANYFAIYTAFTGNTKAMLLPDDGAVAVRTTWNNTSPTATTFTVENDSRVFSSGRTYVAYLFATCAGVSKVGNYTGTAALLTVDCGFTSGARFVLIKRTNSTGDWYVWDSARGISSGNDPYLLLNTTGAEVTGTNYVDTDTTGFKVTAAAPAALNANGGTYIFLAIA
jgi:hypothetical protein